MSGTVILTLNFSRSSPHYHCSYYNHKPNPNFNALFSFSLSPSQSQHRRLSIGKKSFPSRRTKVSLSLHPHLSKICLPCSIFTYCTCSFIVWVLSWLFCSRHVTFILHHHHFLWLVGSCCSLIFTTRDSVFMYSYSGFMDIWIEIDQIINWRMG